MFHVPEPNRIIVGPLGSSAWYGNNGAFLVRVGNRTFYTIASDGGGWEHVSVSLADRAPNWEEMCAIKATFWHEDDLVVQYHPPKSEYVNNHPNCLHLWRPIDEQLPFPPSWMVGIK